MDIHERIRVLREAKGLSQSDIANSLKIATQNYWKIEKGKTELTVSRLTQIAEILGVSVIKLLTGEAQKVEDSEEVKKLEEEVKYWINKQKQDEKRSKQDLLFMAKMADKLAIEIEENQSGDIEKLRQGMTEMFKNLSGFFQMAANGESVYAIMEVMTSKIEKGFTSEKNS